VAELKVTLKRGLKFGDVAQLDAVLREGAAGDVIDAAEESEKLVATPDGYQLVQSPTLVGVHMLRRQVVRIGEIEGPLTLKQLKMLDPADLSELQRAAQSLDAAAVEQASREVAQRGRADGAAPAR
jgi:phage FluMu protein gp41